MAIYYVNANHGTIKIPLTQGHVAVIDILDLPLVVPYTWRVSLRKRTAYADASLPRRSGKQVTIRMHRLIMDAPIGLQVDHIDGNGLNNCRHNLRLATNAENHHNTRKLASASTAYKGVYWYKRDSIWVAQITHKGANIYLGRYQDEAAAAHAYDAAARKLFGEFARCNFVVTVSPQAKT